MKTLRRVEGTCVLMVVVVPSSSGELVGVGRRGGGGERGALESVVRAPDGAEAVVREGGREVSGAGRVRVRLQ